MKETENQTSKEIEQVNKENVLVDLKKPVIFIAGVIMPQWRLNLRLKEYK